MILPSGLNAGFSWASVSRLVSGRIPWSVTIRVAVDREGHDLALEAALLGRLVGEPVRAHRELVELRAGDLPLVGDHLRAEALADDVVLGHQLGGEGEAELLLGLHPRGEGEVAHVLDAAADHRVVHARGDQRGGEVDGLLGGAALAIHRGGGGLDRQALLQPRVAGDVEGLLAELLHAARDHVFDLGGVDAGAGDHLGVALAQQRVGVGVLVVALLLVPTPDRGAHRLDDHDLTALWLSSFGSPPCVAVDRHVPRSASNTYSTA